MLLGSGTKTPAGSPRPIDPASKPTGPSAVDRSGTAAERQAKAVQQKEPVAGGIVNKEGKRIKVGDRCTVHDKGPGTIMFLGETQFKAGIWAGVALDQPLGKHNGSVRDVRYFTCAEMHGIFAYAHALLPEIELVKLEQEMKQEAEALSPEELRARVCSTLEAAVSDGSLEAFYNERPAGEGERRDRMATDGSCGEDDGEIICEYSGDFCLLDPDGKEIDSLEDLVGCMQKTIDDNKALQEQLKKSSETAQALQAELAKLKQDMANSKSPTTGVQRAVASNFEPPSREAAPPAAAATAAVPAAASSPQLSPAAPWPTSTGAVCSQQVIANPHVLMTNFMLF